MRQVLEVGPLEECQIVLAKADKLCSEECLKIFEGIRLKIVHSYTQNLIDQADLVLSMCGTAAEQAVMIGKPVLAIKGKGPQFTERFAKRQKRLLGDNYFLASASTDKIFEWIHGQMQKPSSSVLTECSRSQELGFASKTIAREIIHNMDTFIC